MNKILKFKIWGNYAHFKKFYTTTSPLTFEFPPPPTIIGMISAIIGLDKSEYLRWFQNRDEYKISLSIGNPINKVRWSQNLIDTKHSFWLIKNRTQIRIEYLKNPAYFIYFYHKDPIIYDKLKENLENHNSIYSLCLGLSELLANFEYIDEISLQRTNSGDWINLDSVIPVSSILDKNSIDFELTREIFKVNYPILMLPDRVVDKREDILFERNGESIKCKLEEYWKLENGENIVFF
jgi:CRISPR-associated protein Cas5h